MKQGLHVFCILLDIALILTFKSDLTQNISVKHGVDIFSFTEVLLIPFLRDSNGQLGPLMPRGS